MGKAWLILSGKGGVGKSTIAAALATALSLEKERVCVIDADIGLRDLDILLGLENRIVYDLLDVLNGDCTLKQALVEPLEYSRLSLLPAAQMARSGDLDPKAFVKQLKKLKLAFDHVLIDCPTGMEESVRALMTDACDEVLVVCTPDDMCIRNAERMLALTDEKQMKLRRLIVNRLQSDLIAAGEMYPAATVAATLDVPLLGEIPDDPILYRALLRHRNPLSFDCEGQRAFRRIAQRMRGVTVALPAFGSHKPGLVQRLTFPRMKEVRPD